MGQGASVRLPEGVAFVTPDWVSRSIPKHHLLPEEQFRPPGLAPAPASPAAATQAAAGHDGAGTGGQQQQEQQEQQQPQQREHPTGADAKQHRDAAPAGPEPTSSTATVPFSSQQMWAAGQDAQQQDVLQGPAFCRVERRGSEFVAVQGAKPLYTGGAAAVLGSLLLVHAAQHVPASGCLQGATPALHGAPTACGRSLTTKPPPGRAARLHAANDRTADQDQLPEWMDAAAACSYLCRQTVDKLRAYWFHTHTAGQEAPPTSPQVFLHSRQSRLTMHAPPLRPLSCLPAPQPPKTSQLNGVCSHVCCSRRPFCVVQGLSDFKTSVYFEGRDQFQMKARERALSIEHTFMLAGHLVSPARCIPSAPWIWAGSMWHPSLCALACRPSTKRCRG